LKKIAIILLLALSFNLAFADEIFITKRSDGDKTIFDGKWTFLHEWKSTTEDKINFDDGTKFVIKTGHDYENIYVMINFISDTKNDVNLDKGIICFDKENEKNKSPDENDYCFWITSGSKKPISIKGDSNFSSVGNWKNISNNPSLIAIGGISDQNDRYTKIPHLTYEFKIPIEQIGKTDVYGFYVAVYDGSTDNWYSWPKDTTVLNYPFIPSPDQWGDLISPDKSIPEFEIPLIILVSILIPIFLVKFNKKLFVKF